MISPKENEACDEDGCDFINCCVACAKVEYDGEGNVTGGWYGAHFAGQCVGDGREGFTSLDEDDLDPSLGLVEDLSGKPPTRLSNFDWGNLWQDIMNEGGPSQVLQRVMPPSVSESGLPEVLIETYDTKMRYSEEDLKKAHIIASRKSMRDVTIQNDLLCWMKFTSNRRPYAHKLLAIESRGHSTPA
jgi:hypothetical protein